MGGIVLGYPALRYAPVWRALAVVVYLGLAGVTGGCSPGKPSYLSLLNDDEWRVSDVDRAAAEIAAGRYGNASLRLNASLTTNISDARLHFLNGLAYHLRGRQGLSNRYLLAQHGYRVAIRLDPSNPLYYRQLGRLEEELGNFGSALRYQTEAALLDQDSASQRALTARAAYLAGQVRQALVLYETLLADTPGDNDALTGAALAAAACREYGRAAAHVAAFAQTGATHEAVAALNRRIASWEHFHRYGKSLLADAARSKPEHLTPAEKATPPDSIVFDIMFIELARSVTSRQGINLLEGLSLTLGQDSDGVSGLSFLAQSVKQTGSVTKTLVRALHLPAVTYSLNIFNASEARAEVLNNTSLVAAAGKESVLFSGLEITAAEVSGGDADPVQFNKEIGIKLTLLPENREDGRIAVKVGVENSTLSAPNTQIITFSLRIDVSKTTANLNAVLDFDQTLVIGGLNQRVTRTSADGTPVVGEMPIIENLFSNRAHEKVDLSIVILITPRAAVSLEERVETLAGKMFANETGKSQLNGYLNAIGAAVDAKAARNDQVVGPIAARIIRLRDLPSANWMSQATLRNILKQARE